ncbi:hypothetical protein GF1_28880 [Desulfolithobacter dissulfuricans]|uniref:Zinc finger/thioredoxin putative domain-containing protein n=1 Tax=Desulfolithobacter dissulfuricans TaxID=2795293 RepID=A0A915XKV8_9BACT|nr:hypothetical protein [Desulfolithobacter dissulfuricans]BCO10512.1 hypothetical protein GF1_28880 [Desulfolithobacter dissulfuricans]
MISSCPHCQTKLQFTEAQKAKLQHALARLEPGKNLSIKCPNCHQAIRLGREHTTDKGDRGLRPPPPPDINWLKDGRFETDDKIQDVPMALIMHPDPAVSEKLKTAMESVGYQVMIAESVANARERMQFVNFACVVLHSRFEGSSLDESTFHQFMRKMAMDRRRYVFYILMGPEFHSLYDLQALSCSANLVVNDQDLKYFDTILRKAIPDYEELFGPLLEELGAHGKR